MLEEANLFESDLTHTDLRGARLYGIYAQGANLTGADLAAADLESADLARADLTGAKLTGAVLHDAGLSGAFVAHADFTGADLTDASLYKVNHLDHAVLRDADMRGAELETRVSQESVLHIGGYGNVLFEAHTSRGTFMGARWSEETRWPLTMVDRIRDCSEEIEPGVWQIVRT